MTDLPYIQRLYVFWLMEQAEVDGIPVVTDLPHDASGNAVPFDEPWVEVFSLPGSIRQGGTIYWLEDTLLQVHCFAQKRHATFELARTVRTITAERFTGVIATDYDEASINKVRPGGIHPDLDDRFGGRSVHRARFDLLVSAHPLTATGS